MKQESCSEMQQQREIKNGKENRDESKWKTRSFLQKNDEDPRI